MTTVPQPVLGPTGYIAPEEAAILSAVQADLNTAFGGGLNPALNTPQGQIAQSLTAIIGDKDSQFLYFVSQVDPQYSSGRMQDAIGRIYFMEREPAMPTKVVATCTGLPGTVIPANAQAKDTSGNLYFTQHPATIGVGSTVDVDFFNLASGPIPCPAGTLTTIYISVPGWDTITNAADGELGRFVENAQAFEFRRKNSVAANALGSVPSVYAAVFASGADLGPPNVPSDVLVTHNPTGSPLVVGGVTLIPHSVYVAAVGGDDDAIAQAMWKKVAIGCDFNGNTTVVVNDDSYSPPIAYSVTFERPPAKVIYFTVNIVNAPDLPADIVALTKAAVVAAFEGLDGGAPVRIGGTTYASRFYAPVLGIGPSVQLDSIYVGTAPAPGSGLSVTSRINQHPTTALADVTVNLV